MPQEESTINPEEGLDPDTEPVDEEFVTPDAAVPEESFQRAKENRTVSNLTPREQKINLTMVHHSSEIHKWPGVVLTNV